LERIFVETKSGPERDPYEVARRRMVTDQLMPRGIEDGKVLDAMAKVKRHVFVPPGMENQAYLDRPLHVGFGQTISQPLMVALMTQELSLAGSERVLEIGTGSGYQAAVLSLLAKEVYTIERIYELSIAARKALYRLRYENVKLRIGDGTLGWPEMAPFDRIIVTAGAPCVPKALKEQLTDDGMLVIPVGGEELQYLEVFTKKGDSYQKKVSTACRFVKLIGKEGWSD
jgi:protein-L-isoaspartate(D-aspartate) O-methyltransferase